MATYRMTIRFGRPRQQYRVLDVQASSLAEALRRASEQFPAEAAETADLLEIRPVTEPDARAYSPG